MCIMFAVCSREGFWQCWWIHCCQFQADWHHEELRCWLHLHHFSASHRSLRSSGFHQGESQQIVINMTLIFYDVHLNRCSCSVYNNHYLYLLGAGFGWGTTIAQDSPGECVLPEGPPDGRWPPCGSLSQPHHPHTRQLHTTLNSIHYSHITILLSSLYSICDLHVPVWLCYVYVPLYWHCLWYLL